MPTRMPDFVQEPRWHRNKTLLHPQITIA